MKAKDIYKKGQRVKIENNSNASDFNMNQEWDIMGAYSIVGWRDKEFEIEGTVKLITFDHSDEIYGAYLLKHAGKNVGYIYNTGIKPIKEGCRLKSLFMTFFDGCYGVESQSDVPNTFAMGVCKLEYDEDDNRLTVHLRRPGLLIGLGGRTVDALQKYLDCEIGVVEVNISK